jgi:hypothetical protein
VLYEGYHIQFGTSGEVRGLGGNGIQSQRPNCENYDFFELSAITESINKVEMIMQGSKNWGANELEEKCWEYKLDMQHSRRWLPSAT